MNNTTQNEGMWDRLSAGLTGVKTAASNIGAGVSSIASGQFQAGAPLNLTKVQDAKIKKLFSLAQSRMEPFVKNLKSKNIISKTNAEIEVKKQLLGFLEDFMKMTGEKNPNKIIATLQKPEYNNITDYLKKIGVSVPVSSKKKSKSPSPAPSSSPAPSPAPSSSGTPTSGTPKDGAIDLSNNYKFDAGKGLWVNVTTGVPLNKAASNSKTIGYWNAVKAGKLVPEGVTKITYKEFFV